MKTTRTTKTCKKCGIEILKGIFCKFHSQKRVIESKIWQQST